MKPDDLEPPDDGDDLQQALTLQGVMLKRVEGKVSGTEAAAYTRIRGKLMKSQWKQRMPRLVAASHSIDAVWGDINKFGKWEERRQYIRAQFADLLAAIENVAVVPGAEGVSDTLSALTSGEVTRLWHKAQARLVDDPDGAITAARSLLESVCKRIGAELCLHNDVDKLDLPTLYRLVAGALNLSPSEHTEQVFKEILSGCFSVVNGFAALRNKVSDAHGIGPTRVNPAPRHAALAVGLAGTVSLFLLETWAAQQGTAAA